MRMTLLMSASHKKIRVIPGPRSRPPKPLHMRSSCADLTMKPRTRIQDRSSRNVLFWSAIICLVCVPLSWAWTPAIKPWNSFIGIKSTLPVFCGRSKCILKSIQMTGVPPPPQQQPSSSNPRRNSMRKPPPPPPTRAIEEIDNIQSTESPKRQKKKNSQEGTFSNPIEGAVYQDEKGYAFL